MLLGRAGSTSPSPRSCAHPPHNNRQKRGISKGRARSRIMDHSLAKGGQPNELGGEPQRLLGLFLLVGFRWRSFVEFLTLINNLRTRSKSLVTLVMQNFPNPEIPGRKVK